MDSIRHLFAILVCACLAVPLQTHAVKKIYEGSAGSILITQNNGGVRVYAVDAEEGQNDSITLKRRHHGALPFIPATGLTIGTFWLPDVDYGDYSAFEGLAGSDFLEQDLGRSFSITIPFVGLSRHMNSARTLQFETNVEMSIHNLVFSNSIALTRMPGTERVYPVAVEPELKKSKLCLTYLELPVRLTIKTGHARQQRDGIVNTNHTRRLLTAGIVPGLLLNEHTKTKSPKEKDRLHCAENFRCNAEVRLWLHPSLYLSGTYSLTPLFKGSQGPVTHPVTIGLGFIL